MLVEFENSFDVHKVASSLPTFEVIGGFDDLTRENPDITLLS
jgi:hypothetical protein